MTSQSISASFSEHFKAEPCENMGNRSVPGMGVREWATIQKLPSDDHQQMVFKMPSNERYFYCTSQIPLTWMNCPELIAIRDPIPGVLLMAGL